MLNHNEVKNYLKQNLSDLISYRNEYSDIYNKHLRSKEIIKAHSDEEWMKVGEDLNTLASNILYWFIDLENILKIDNMYTRLKDSYQNDEISLNDLILTLIKLIDSSFDAMNISKVLITNEVSKTLH